MSELASSFVVSSPAPAPPTALSHSRRAIRLCLLLSALALWCILWSSWQLDLIPASHRAARQSARPALALHDVNRITIALSCGVAAKAALLTAAWIFLGWSWGAGRLLRIAFLAQWVATAALLLVLMRSWWPGNLP
jgi:hypothetical protein